MVPAGAAALRLLARRPARLAAGWRGPAAGTFPLHQSPCLELVWHRSCRGYLLLPGDRRLAFAPGTLLILPARLPRGSHHDGPGEDWCLRLRPPPGLRLEGPVAVDLTDDAWAAGEMEVLTRAGRNPPRPPGPALHLRASALLAHLLDRSRPPPPEAAPAVPDHAARAKALIDADPAGISVVGEVARRIGIGEDHLRHLFKRAYDLSLVRYLGQARLQKAKLLLLAEPDLPVGEVARRCGYERPRWFATAFRAGTGLAPRDFRRRGGG